MCQVRIPIDQRWLDGADHGGKRASDNDSFPVQFPASIAGPAQADGLNQVCRRSILRLRSALRGDLCLGAYGTVAERAKLIERVVMGGICGCGSLPAVLRSEPPFRSGVASEIALPDGLELDMVIYQAETSLSHSLALSLKAWLVDLPEQ